MNQTHTINKQKKSPVAMTLLTLLRLCMLWLICSYYLFHIQGSVLEQRIFVVICLIALTINHLMIGKQATNRMKLFFFVLDLVFISSFGIAFPNPNGPFPILFGVDGVTLFLLECRRKVLITGTILLFVFLVCTLGYDVYRQPGSSVWLILFNSTFMIFSCLVGWLIRHFRETQTKISDLYHRLELSHIQLQNTYDQLQEYAKQVENLTTVREQNRIAREIHDTVGHSMTLLIVQLKVAQKMMNKEPAAANEAISNCEQVARSALEQIRGSVKEIESSNTIDIPFLTRLTYLTQRFADMATVSVELQIDGDVEATRTTVQPVILHTIQESLTNAVRHGNARMIQVHLQNEPNGIQLDILDDGHGTGPFTKGFGITNMERQIVSFGGTLNCTSEVGSGFQISAHLPSSYYTYGFKRRE